MDQAGDDGLPADILMDAPDQAGIDLEEVGPQLHEVVEIGDPGAGVVDGQSNVGAQAQDRRPQRGVLGDGFVLGDLQDDRPAPRGQHPGQCRAIGDQRRRGIEAEPCPSGQELGTPERGLEGHCLELDRETTVEGVGEDLVGPAAVAEPGERLEADDPTGGQLDDGLEDRREGRQGDHGFDPSMGLRPAALGFPGRRHDRGQALILQLAGGHVASRRVEPGPIG